MDSTKSQMDFISPVGHALPPQPINARVLISIVIAFSCLAIVLEVSRYFLSVSYWGYPESSNMIFLAAIQTVVLAVILFVAARRFIGQWQDWENLLQEQTDKLFRLHQENQEIIARQQSELDHVKGRCDSWQRVSALPTEHLQLEDKIQQILNLGCQLTKSKIGLVKVIKENNELEVYTAPKGIDLDIPSLIDKLTPFTVMQEFSVRLGKQEQFESAFITSLLLISICLRGEIIGYLYLVNKLSEDEFSEEDEVDAKIIAAQVAASISLTHANRSDAEETRQASEVIDQTVQKLPHEHIVYLARDEIPRLFDLLRERQLSEDEALNYIYQTATYLISSHKRNLPFILRPDSVAVDLKKAKVYLWQSPSGPGLSADTDYFEGFNAPEVGAQEASPKSDVFSLGVYLFLYYYQRLPPHGSQLNLVLDHLNIPTNYVGIDYLLRKSLWPIPEYRLADASEFVNLFNTIRTRTEQKLSGNGQVKLDIGAELNAGLRKGRYQGQNAQDLEDRLFWDINSGKELYLLAIADGVSRADIGTGYRAAIILTDEAARGWKEIVADQQRMDSNKQVHMLKKILTRANEAIVSEIKPQLSKWKQTKSPETMAAAVCLALGRADQVTFANLGDVHAYLITPHFVSRLTEIHTNIAEVLTEPKFTYTSLDNLSGSALSRNLGNWQQLRNGAIEPQSVKPKIVTQPLLPGDSIVLASDGLHGYARKHQGLFEDTLREVLQDTPDAQMAAFRLMALANNRGGGDNISCIVCRILSN